MELNTSFNDLVGCPLALYKLKVNPLSKAGERLVSA